MGAHVTTGNSGGAILPATLVLLAAAILTALAALQSAASETRLSSTLLANYRAFALAEMGIAVGLQRAEADPGSLSDTAAIALPDKTIAGMGRVSVVIQPLARDDQCPELAPLPAIRQHFAIVATATTADNTKSAHTQGFYVCRESCATAACVAAELPPVRTFWQMQSGSTP